MAERAVAKRAPPKIAAVEDAFDAKATIMSSHTGELVVALCGPIGSPIHKVAETIKARLKDDFGYESCEIIRLSKFIEKYGASATGLKATHEKKL